MNSSLADTAVDFCPQHMTEQWALSTTMGSLFPASSFSAWPLTWLNAAFFHETKQKKCPPRCSLPHRVGLNGKHQHERIACCTKSGSGFPDGDKPCLGSSHCCTRNCPSSGSEGLFWNNVLEGSWQLFLTVPSSLHTASSYSYRIVVCKDQIKSFPYKL